MKSEPVTHDESLEAPLLAKDSIQETIMFTCTCVEHTLSIHLACTEQLHQLTDAIDTIVCSHDARRLTLERVLLKRLSLSLSRYVTHDALKRSKVDLT